MIRYLASSFPLWLSILVSYVVYKRKKRYKMTKKDEEHFREVSKKQ